MTGAELARALATDVLGWTDRNGFWFYGESCIGLRVPQEDSDLETLGFFRPDKSLIHVGMVTFWIERHSPAKKTIDFPGGKIRVEFNDGVISVVGKDEWTAWTSVYTVAEVALAYWREHRDTSAG